MTLYLIDQLCFAVQEINSKERDQFWLKEELEERKRVEAERKRREEVKFEFLFNESMKI